MIYPKLVFIKIGQFFLYAVEKLNEIGNTEKEIYSRKLGNFMYLPVEPLGLADISVVYGDMIDRDYDNGGYRVFNSSDEMNESIDDFESNFSYIDTPEENIERYLPLDFNDDNNVGKFDDYFNLFS